MSDDRLDELHGLLREARRTRAPRELWGRIEAAVKARPGAPRLRVGVVRVAAACAGIAATLLVAVAAGALTRPQLPAPRPAVPFALHLEQALPYLVDNNTLVRADASFDRFPETRLAGRWHEHK